MNLRKDHYRFPLQPAVSAATKHETRERRRYHLQVCCYGVALQQQRERSITGARDRRLTSRRRFSPTLCCRCCCHCRGPRPTNTTTCPVSRHSSHTHKTVKTKTKTKTKQKQTLDGGSLGSSVDEERGQPRELMRIAGLSEHRHLERTLRLRDPLSRGPVRSRGGNWHVFLLLFTQRRQRGNISPSSRSSLSLLPVPAVLPGENWRGDRRDGKRDVAGASRLRLPLADRGVASDDRVQKQKETLLAPSSGGVASAMTSTNKCLLDKKRLHRSRPRAFFCCSRSTVRPVFYWTGRRARRTGDRGVCSTLTAQAPARFALWL